MRIETRGIPDQVLDRYWDTMAEQIAAGAPGGWIVVRMWDDDFETPEFKDGALPAGPTVSVVDVRFRVQEFRSGTRSYYEDHWLVVSPETTADSEVLAGLVERGCV